MQLVEKTNKQKNKTRAGRMTQGVGLEFKPQHHTKKKNARKVSQGSKM
jgi:hypothetical protein